MTPDESIEENKFFNPNYVTYCNIELFRKNHTGNATVKKCY